MTQDACAAMRLLVQADADGELSAAEAAPVAAHLEHCPDCAAVQAGLLALSADIRRGVTRYPAPDTLRTDVLTRIAAMAPDQAPAAWWRHPAARRGVPFGAGFALAASLALFVVLPGGDALRDSVIAGHIRALQPGHLLDVVSTDQHTVKPWFDGRLDFAPVVKDFAAEGFPLAGGRLDVLSGRPVAALVYRRRQHVIDLFVAPATRRAGPSSSSASGYTVVSWTRDGMTFWAVSDLDPAELSAFVRLLRTS